MKINLENNGIKSEIETLGAYVNTLSKNGVNIFFPKSKIDENGTDKLRGGSHPCLPHFGVSKKVVLSNHGFARDLEWNVKYQSDSEVVLSLKPDVENWEGMYAEITYSIKDNYFITKLLVRNDGEKSIDVSPAFHPYFNYTDENEIFLNGEKFEMNRETLPNSLFVDEVNSMKTSEYVIEIENKDMPKFVIWTNFTDKYLCVEPTFNWQALDKDRELCAIEAGEEKEFEYRVKIK
ncbi:aldose epimerase family protein [Helcococcus kunzii]|uniref:aldose epimerase family protein n=1 Tax=Helcococcus kunzii TaxID=40091 RepID=UPI0021A80C98|nr:hypothetical protein [Helcococcus kunzii]MCT1796742.1 hypothetical protein [Helcococcus kunzii]MCT1988870.1 hypothetical protein [Helcococcus kunzii]